ncbi:MAG: hypothetical protein ACXVIB_03775 [Halobacteriota archaeon]
MGLEHAQHIRREQSVAVKASRAFSAEARVSLLVADLIIDLIEEVRWLRTDLYNQNQNK